MAKTNNRKQRTTNENNPHNRILERKHSESIEIIISMKQTLNPMKQTLKPPSTESNTL